MPLTKQHGPQEPGDRDFCFEVSKDGKDVGDYQVFKPDTKISDIKAGIISAFGLPEGSTVTIKEKGKDAEMEDDKTIKEQLAKPSFNFTAVVAEIPIMAETNQSLMAEFADGPAGTHGYSAGKPPVAESAGEPPVAESAGEPMRITVRPLSGNAEELEVNGSDNVLNVKERLQERMGISPFQMVLVRGKKPLLDDLAILTSLDIKDGTLLTLIKKCFPPPTIKDSEKITKLAAANDVDGLRQAAMEGYDLNVIACVKDSPMNALYPTLHVAVYQENFEMMKLVLETGVSVFSLTDKYPKTALQVAAKWGKRDMCELLITYGLDPHEVDTMTSDGSGRRIESWTAIKYAESKGHDDLAAWLKEQSPPTTTYSVIE